MCGHGYKWPEDDLPPPMTDEIARLRAENETLREAVAAERERCAKVAEEYAVPLRVNVENAADAHTFALNTVGIAIVEAIAAAIRTGERG